MEATTTPPPGATAPTAPTRTAPAARPLGIALAVAVLGLIGLAGLMVGPYLIVLGRWLADRVADATPLVMATEAILGVGCIAIGIAALVTARGLWQASAWAWPVAMSIGLVLVTGMALIWLLGTWVAAYGLVALIAIVLIATLLPGGVRREFGL